MLTESEYKTLRKRYDDYHNALDRFKWNWVDENRAALLPPPVTPDETSTLEVYDFVDNPPDKYFAYVNSDKKQITTWTGERLGDCTFGREYHSNMGDLRVSIHVRAINGRRYHGTYYKSAGDYCRLKVCK